MHLRVGKFIKSWGYLAPGSLRKMVIISSTQSQMISLAHHDIQWLQALFFFPGMCFWKYANSFPLDWNFWERILEMIPLGEEFINTSWAISKCIASEMRWGLCGVVYHAWSCTHDWQNGVNWEGQLCMSKSSFQSCQSSIPRAYIFCYNVAAEEADVINPFTVVGYDMHSRSQFLTSLASSSLGTL